MFLMIKCLHSSIFASNVSSLDLARLLVTDHLKKRQIAIAERHYYAYNTDSDSVEVYHYFANDYKRYS